MELKLLLLLNFGVVSFFQCRKRLATATFRGGYLANCAFNNVSYAALCFDYLKIVELRHLYTALTIVLAKLLEGAF